MTSPQDDAGQVDMTVDLDALSKEDLQKHFYLVLRAIENELKRFTTHTYRGCRITHLQAKALPEGESTECVTVTQEYIRCVNPLMEHRRRIEETFGKRFPVEENT